MTFGLAAATLATNGSVCAAEPSLGGDQVFMPNCPFDPHAPHQMRCLSSRLVPRSYAEARARLLTPAPDAGFGVDASSAIGTCHDISVGGSGNGKKPDGLGPADFATAYNILASPTGAGKVVAIVDACSNPFVVSDLAAYRQQFGLPALPECGGKAIGHAPVPGDPACFGIVSQRGDTSVGAPNEGWAVEIALDVEMVSAVCPECSILLVEADSPNAWDLGPAVNEAVALGAAAVSNSYGAPEDPHDPFGTAYSDGPYIPYYEHPGVLIAASSGDGAYNNSQLSPGNTVLAPSFPSTVASVLSVGGTALTMGAGGARGGYSEISWLDTTSGCSGEIPGPAFQDGIKMGSCTMRADVDVSAVADRVAWYAGGGWGVASGTSCASPLVAALLTRVGLADHDNAFFYANAPAFYDVTLGNNDPSGACHDVMCNCGVGWDGPTGWGSPNAAALATLGASDGGAGNDAGPGTTAGGNSDAGMDATTRGADSGGGSDGNGATGSSSGCGCKIAESSPATPAGLLLAALAGVAARLRRRK
jgi:MYXO-CTERM domain-containing protein